MRVGLLLAPVGISSKMPAATANAAKAASPYLRNRRMTPSFVVTNPEPESVAPSKVGLPKRRRSDQTTRLTAANPEDLPPAPGKMQGITEEAALHHFEHSGEG